jgi:hypothetical protein
MASDPRIEFGPPYYCMAIVDGSTSPHIFFLPYKSQIFSSYPEFRYLLLQELETCMLVFTTYFMCIFAKLFIFDGNASKTKSWSYNIIFTLFYHASLMQPAVRYRLRMSHSIEKQSNHTDSALTPPPLLSQPIGPRRRVLFACIFVSVLLIPLYRMPSG